MLNIFEFINTQIHNNQFFVTVLFGALVSAGAVLGKRLTVVLYRYLSVSIFVQLESSTAGEYILIEKLIELKQLINHTKDITITQRYLGNRVWKIDPCLTNGTFISFVDYKIWIVTKQQNVLSDRTVKSIRLTVFPSISKNYMHGILSQLTELHNNVKDRRLFKSIVMPDVPPNGTEIVNVKTMNDIILPELIKSELINDLSSFLQSRDWYTSHHILFKR
jgi:hypothetical protein